MKSIQKLIPLHFFSLLAVITFSITANTTINTEGTYNKWGALVKYDQGGYYGYMPAILIHNDLDFKFYERLGFNPKAMMIPLKDGQKVNRYAIGPAILCTPFFLIGHSIAKNSDRHMANGYSKPYKKWVLLGCIFYVSLALFMIRSVLLRYYDDVVVMLTILALGLGSNLLYYTAIEGMMSHAYSFFLYSLLLWATIKWLEDAKKHFLLLIGISLGLIAATRLPNLIVGLIPLFWGIKKKEDIRPRLQLVWEQKLWILAALSLFVLGYLPQLLYYKAKVGSYFVNSYPNSRFWFDQPLAHRVLFSIRKGWLVYSPLMAMGISGFFLIRKYCQSAFLPLLSFFILNLYVVSSWWCWWYGGSFGMRALIESSALLSLTIAATISYLIHKNNISRALFIILFPTLIALSLFQTHQAAKGIIRFDGMNWEAYKMVFGKKAPVSQEFFQKRDSIINYKYNFIKAAKDKEFRYNECR